MRILENLLCIIGCSVIVDGAFNVIRNDSYATLSDASNVLQRLSNAEQHLFATTFFKIRPTKLTSALESASMVAGMPKGYFDGPGENVLKNIFENIKLISSNLKDLYAITGVNSNDFSTDVTVPLGAASHGILYYRDNRAEFMEIYKEGNVEKQVSLILNVFALSLPKNVTITTRFEKQKFEAVESLIVQNFFQAYLLQYFRVGIQHNATTEYIADQKNLSKNFMTDYQQLIKMWREVSAFYRASFFPGFVKEDFVRPDIDCIRNRYHHSCTFENMYFNENCNIAHSIVRNISAKFPWRNYAAIVSDSAIYQSDYAYFGFPNRTVLEENYNGKTVLVFMATKQYTKNYETFTRNNESQMILRKEINGNIDSLLDYAKLGVGRVQMAVFNERVNPCFMAGKEKIGHQSVWDRMSSFDPLKLGVFVVF